MPAQCLTVIDRKRGAILGAAVADAASMGFHWLYDQTRIKELAPTTPEFRQPSAADYAGVRGYFAHAVKTAGDFSQYGEQHNAMLLALSDNNGVYDKSKYENAFVDIFGYGGSYHGYIDRPTRDTLDNITLAETHALAQANAIPFEGEDSAKSFLIAKVFANAKQYSGAELKKQIAAAVRQNYDDDSHVQHAFTILDLHQSLNGDHGADDTQHPALSKLPALVAIYAQTETLQSVVDSAIRVTNNNEEAVAFGLAAANMIEAAITTGDPELCIDAANQALSGIARPLVSQARSALDMSTPEATANWGLACQLSAGFPSAIHNISKSESYTEAVRQNIYAGGDSCGRAILIGAIMGACHGVGTESGIPEEWINKLTHSEDTLKCTAKLLDTE